MLIKTIAGVTLFALVGGAIGYSQVLCPDGQCSITGTPYGGALFGSILGLAVMSSLGSNSVSSNAPDQPEVGDDSDTDRTA